MAAHRGEGKEIPSLFCSHCHRKTHDIHKMAAPTTAGMMQPSIFVVGPYLAASHCCGMFCIFVYMNPVIITLFGHCSTCNVLALKT